MRIFLAGVSCVGKTTIGARLAGCLECQFFDLDVEVERFFGTSIGRLRNRYPASHDFRRMAARALKHVLSRDDGRNCVIALPPSGLLGSYWKAIKDTRDTVVVLRDTPENILGRITFYDIDSHPVQKNLTDREKRLYLRPSKTRCRSISVLKVEDEGKVLGMAAQEVCESEIFVWVRRAGERIAVPLAQLRPLSKDQETQEAVGDWLQWIVGTGFERRMRSRRCHSGLSGR